MARRRLEVQPKARLSLNNRAMRRLSVLNKSNKLNVNIKLPHKNYLLSGALILVILLAGFLAAQFHIFSDGDLRKPAIAKIPIYGEIALNENQNQVIKLIEQADSDIGIKAIILEINSPGGTVVASQEIAKAVRETKKPTIAYIREIGASGAYWVATEADVIVANDAAITGSIGVTSSYLQFADLFDNYGVTYERLVTGEFKDAGSPYKQLTPQERTYLQAKINKIYDMFVTTVATNRHMTKAKVESLATGEIWLGVEAKELGLVDETGDFKAAQKAAEKLIGAGDSRIIEYAPQTSVFSWADVKIEQVAFWMGKGIGMSWSPITDAKEDITLRAQLY